MVGRLIESWSHANVDMSFGKVGERLIVGPRFHRLHHARANPDERHIHDHNFAPVFPIWDILFGTAIYDGKHRPTGVDDPRGRCRQRPRLDRPAGDGVRPLPAGDHPALPARASSAWTSAARGIGVTAP